MMMSGLDMFQSGHWIDHEWQLEGSVCSIKGKNIIMLRNQVTGGSEKVGHWNRGESNLTVYRN